jgi:CARDB
MLRIALIAALGALALPATAAASGPASVSLIECQSRDRTAEFEARMDRIAGSARMKLRYTLEARKPDRRWRRVDAPELGGWRLAEPETTRFISSRTVAELVGPAHYRAVVRFRWLDADGATVAASKARSRACWQPDHRPNLRLRELMFDAPGSYLVRVANTGRSASGAFDLEVSGLPPVVVADELEPGEERLVEVDGVACEPGSEVTATADPLDEIDERSERDNALTVICP